MSKAQKRKRLNKYDGESKTPANKSTVDGGNPYPTLLRPTAEECRDVRDALLSLHGFPPEFANYRRQRLRSFSAVDDHDTQCNLKSETLNETEEESVLDGLVKILLSQNTTESNSQRAFASLKATFPKWDDVSAMYCEGLSIVMLIIVMSLG